MYDALRAAVAAIARLEPFDRERYAGATGWIGAAGEGEWVIALRCAGIGEPAIKDRLKANTEEAARRGAFGSPTIFLDGADMYFGNDRLPLIRDALKRRKSAA